MTYSIKLAKKKRVQTESSVVVQDVTRLIVPSAETPAIFGTKYIEILI
jgi:hypothetical protein